jgi:hypothetical protein
MVLQIIPVRFITLIATLAVTGSECELLKHHSTAATIISVIQTLSTMVSFIGVLKLTKFLKPALAGYHPIKKLVALKGLVALDVLQTLIFSILSNHSAIKATKTTNLPDILIGISGLMVCVECLIFSIVVVFAFPIKPYTAQGQDPEQQMHPRMGFASALFNVLNITDLLKGVIFCLSAVGGRGYDNDTQMEEETYRK